MKLMVYNEENAPSTHGTYKVGSLNNITYEELIEVLGEPTFNEPSEDNKVQVEWIVEYKGDIFTIYDWKTFNRDYTKNELTSWSVGGTKPSFSIIRMIYKTLNINKFMKETERMDVTNDELENFLHKKYDTNKEYNVNINKLNTYINGKIDTK